MGLDRTISASLMYGLSWILLGLTTLMSIMAILALLGLVELPISVRTDLIGAAICAGLALFFRYLARKFEGAVYPS